MTRREAVMRADVAAAHAALALALGARRCAGCGSAAVIAVEVGQEEDRTPLFMLGKGRPDRGWCASCWPSARGAQVAA